MSISCGAQSGRVMPMKLLGGEHVHHESQRPARRTVAGVVAIRQVGRDVELYPAAHLDPDETLVPALDDVALAELEAERLGPLPRRVELLAGLERHADVVHVDRLPGRGRRALALDQGRDVELRQAPGTGLDL